MMVDLDVDAFADKLGATLERAIAPIQARIAAFDARLHALETRAAVPGPPGPPGEKGDRGDRGEAPVDLVLPLQQKWTDLANELAVIRDDIGTIGRGLRERLDAIERTPGPPGPRGEPGVVDDALLSDLVFAAVAAQPAASGPPGPPGPPGPEGTLTEIELDVLVERLTARTDPLGLAAEVLGRLPALVEAAVESRRPKDGEPGPVGAVGPPGPPGPAGAAATVDLETLAAQVAEVLGLEAAVERLPALVAAAVEAVRPKDGAPGPAGAIGPPGPPGPPGPVGRDGLPGQPGTPGRDGATGLAGTDGTNGRDGVVTLEGVRVEYDGERTVTFLTERGPLVGGTIRLPIVLDKGIYRDGTRYERGDGVTWRGSYWIAQEAIADKPSGDTDARWRLAVKSGREGKAGPPGPAGPTGPRGEKGDTSAKWPG